ncbi:inorganic diphosphatase [Actinoallomurus acaciae]|uniref:inorganic diphosphatase n=1 Tax=Actinoallomurus acaciae TaxID=502577 RepID=A0ABV5YA71_9ACTN
MAPDLVPERLLREVTMVEITVAVEATAGSPFAPDDGPGAYGSPGGYPIGNGCVTDSLAEDGMPVDVVLLMEEPALPRQAVRARPVALLHAVVDGRPREEVVCVPAGDENFASLTDLPQLADWHADELALAAVLRRLRAGHHCQVTGCEGRRSAETLLARAHHSYERLTGSLE